MHTLARAFKVAGGHWSTYIIWSKDRFTLGRSDYMRQFEIILYGWKEGGEHFWCGAKNEGTFGASQPQAQSASSNYETRGARRNVRSRTAVSAETCAGFFFGGAGSTLIASEKSGGPFKLRSFPEQKGTIRKQFGGHQYREAARGWKLPMRFHRNLLPQSGIMLYPTHCQVVLRDVCARPRGRRRGRS